MIGFHLKEKNFDLPNIITIMGQAKNYDYVFEILKEQIHE
jgi:hypothetical protein